MPQSDDSVQPNSPGQTTENRRTRDSKPSQAAQSRGKVGKVYLVGAGPGDPGLITVRGLQCLQQADVVLYDGLANSSLLEAATRAEKISVGKHGAAPIWTQPQIHEAMLQQARAGKNVVRLKGGDPAIFARSAEELEVLVASQIPFEVVPGITAALAVTSYAGIPLTHRDHASAVALVTGQQQEGAPDDLDWEALASFPGTLVIYMGVTTAHVWAQRLITAGKAADTPVAIVRRCSWSDQWVRRCMLSEVPQLLGAGAKLRPPILVVIGAVAALGEQWNWFEHLPLLGEGVWLPRAAHQMAGLRGRLESLGATVWAEPVIEVRPPQDASQLESAAELLVRQKVDGVTFSSANGVDFFMQHLLGNGHDARVLAGCRLAAVGPATAAALTKFGLHADIVPEAEFSAAGLLGMLRGQVREQHWIVTATNHSRPELADGLLAEGASVTQCLSYETLELAEPSQGLGKAIESGDVRWVIITSSHIAESVHRLVGSVRHLKTVALGPNVADRLQQLGWSPAATTEENSEDGIVTALLQATVSG